MKAAVLYKANQPLEVVELTQEGPKVGEARVKVKAAGICVQNGDAKVLNADGPHKFAGAKIVSLDCQPAKRLEPVTLPASMTKAS